MMRKTVIYFHIIFISFITHSYAFDLDYSYHGSISQTYLQTTGNQEDWLEEFPRTDEGSWKFTEMLLGGSVDLSEKLRFGAQAISRVYGNYGNYDLGLDWGFVDYRFNSYFGIRAGKVRYAAGLYNESRDIDSGRIGVLLSQDVYPERLRSFVNSSTGGSIYGNFENDKAGALDYQITVGKPEIPDDFSLNNIVRAFSPSSEFKGDLLFGFHLEYRAPWDSKLEGLKIVATWSEFKGSSDINDNTTVIAGPNSFSYELDVSTTVIGIEYSALKYTLGAEYAQQQLSSIYPDSVVSPLYWDSVVEDRLGFDSRQFYLFGSYQFVDRYSAQLMWSRNDPKAYDNSRDTYTFSHRYDFNENVIGKLEYRQVYDENGKWGLFLARLSYSF